MGFFEWMSLLAQNRFAVSSKRLMPLMGILASGLSVRPLTSALAYAVHGRKAKNISIPTPPLFVLGHWRSGTTFLHEMLALDSRMQAPNAIEVFRPRQFLLTGDLAKRLLAKKRHSRPMDEMIFSVDKPQEDEFALINMGIPSPTLSMAFPNEPRQHAAYLTLRDLSPVAREKWKRALYTFCQYLAYRHGQDKRLVLKTPAHTARVRTLLEIFPDAKFIFLVRDPRRVFASTLHTYLALSRAFALQEPDFANRMPALVEQTLKTYEVLHQAYEEDKPLIPQGNLIELRYEDLAADPVSMLQEIYSALKLGEFAPARKAVENYLKERQGFRKNVLELSPEAQAQVESRWGFYMRKWGYGNESSRPAAEHQRQRMDVSG